MYHKVSTIIPTLNRAHTLARALKSVFAQSYPIHETIVVDNGSLDCTLDLLSEEFPWVKVVREKKPGVSSARNRGIYTATGDWIAFLDSDDAWLPNKVERQLDSYLNTKQSFRLVHTDEVWYSNGKLLNQKKIHKKSGGNIFKDCVRLCCISPSSVLMRKEIFNDLGTFDEELLVCEDYDLWLRIAAREEVLFVNDPLTIKYGGHKDQLSKKFWGMDRFRVRVLEKIILQGSLTEEQVKLAFHSLMTRLKIIHKGAKKRNNYKIETEYLEKIKKWEGFLSSLDREGC